MVPAAGMYSSNFRFLSRIGAGDGGAVYGGAVKSPVLPMPAIRLLLSFCLSVNWIQSPLTSPNNSHPGGIPPTQSDGAVPPLVQNWVFGQSLSTKQDLGGFAPSVNPSFL